MLQRWATALKLKTDGVVFFSTVAAVIVFVLVTFFFGGWVDTVFTIASNWIMTYLGWFYIAGVSIFLIYLVWIALSRYGHVRLGNDDETAEHSLLAWFAMLFAAGIGSILMFWGVAEPISHFATPPRGDVPGGSVAAAEEAIAFTLYHFGLHTWTIFALPALCFAYFIYKRKMPPRVSSVFAPVLGTLIYGPVGKTIDIVALVGTIFGVATTIGLGTIQINAGLTELFGLPDDSLLQTVIIVLVSIAASISVAMGLEKGIKVLSNGNIVIAVLLLVFVIATGPTLYLLKSTTESFGIYLSWLPELAFWNNSIPGNESLTNWQNTWTVFYWAWTITWSPFVGIFIATISRGRTIREFVFGVLVMPVTFSIIWFSVFGHASFNIEWNEGGGLVTAVVDNNNIPGALFAFLDHFPLTSVISGVAVILVVVFFITSMDSAALVVDMMASGKDQESPWPQRVTWAVLMGLVAVALLVFTGDGGLTALQKVITVIGLPFFVMGYLMMFSLTKGINADMGQRTPIVTRQWKRAYTAKELAAHEAVPSPEPIGPVSYIPPEEEDASEHAHAARKFTTFFGVDEDAAPFDDDAGKADADHDADHDEPA